MQFSTLTLLLASASLVLAQNLTGLPACAVTCFDNNFANSACADTNVTCLCSDTTFFNDVEICVLEGCDGADTATTLTWSTAECAAVGVTLAKRDVITLREAIKRSLFGRKH